MAREILAVHGLENLTEAELRELIATADRRGLDPSYLAAVISFETGGSFNPAEPNKAGSGAIGLIQFMPATAEAYGTTTDDLAHMTVNQQLAYVELHYATVDPSKRVKSLEDHYLAVFSPACIGMPPDTRMPCSPKLTMWRRPDEGCPPSVAGLPRFQKAYCQNRGLDQGGDGTITAFEATTPVRRIVNDAKARAPIVVGDGPIEPERPGPLPVPPTPLVARAGFAGTLAPFVVGAAAGYFAIDWLTKRIR